MSDSNLLKLEIRSRRDGETSLSGRRWGAAEAAATRPRFNTSASKALGSKTVADLMGVHRLLDGIEDLFKPREATAMIRTLVDTAAVPPGFSSVLTDPVRQMLQDNGLSATQMLQDSGVVEAVLAATTDPVPLQWLLNDPVRKVLLETGLTASQLLQDGGLADTAITAASRLGLAGLRPTGFTLRPVERPLSLQPRHRRQYADEVDEFLHRVRPDLVGKRRATLMDLDRSPDPLSQAACSGAELIIHLFCELAPDEEVRREHGGPARKRPPWTDRLLLLRAKYDLDAEAAAVIEHGILHTRNRLEDIKHDTHLHTRGELEEALGDLQRLLLVTARAVTDSIL